MQKDTAWQSNHGATLHRTRATWVVTGYLAASSLSSPDHPLEVQDPHNELTSSRVKKPAGHCPYNRPLSWAQGGQARSSYRYQILRHRKWSVMRPDFASELWGRGLEACLDMGVPGSIARPPQHGARWELGRIDLGTLEIRSTLLLSTSRTIDPGPSRPGRRLLMAPCRAWFCPFQPSTCK